MLFFPEELEKEALEWSVVKSLLSKRDGEASEIVGFRWKLPNDTIFEVKQIAK